MNLHPIPTINDASTKSSSRLARFMVTSTIITGAFVGVSIIVIAAVALIAVRVGTTAVTVLVSVVSADLNVTTNALYNGDSKTRLTVLIQMNQTLKSQTPQPIDPQSAAWILPAIERCRTDSDPEVVALAGKVVDHINDNTSPTPP